MRSNGSAHSSIRRRGEWRTGIAHPLPAPHRRADIAVMRVTELLETRYINAFTIWLRFRDGCAPSATPLRDELPGSAESQPGRWTIGAPPRVGELGRSHVRDLCSPGHRGGNPRRRRRPYRSPRPGKGPPAGDASPGFVTAAAVRAHIAEWICALPEDVTLDALERLGTIARSPRLRASPLALRLGLCREPRPERIVHSRLPAAPGGAGRREHVLVDANRRGGLAAVSARAAAQASCLSAYQLAAVGRVGVGHVGFLATHTRPVRARGARRRLRAKLLTGEADDSLRGTHCTPPSHACLLFES